MATAVRERDAALHQRFASLERANENRIRRARLKRELHDGLVGLVDVLREPEWWLFSMPVFELLLSAPRVGPVGANRMLRRADVWPLREVGALTLRQRMRLIEEIERRVAG